MLTAAAAAGAHPHLAAGAMHNDAAVGEARAVAAAIHFVDDRRVEVAAPQEIRVQRMHRALGLDLPEEDDFTTVAGLVLSLAGRIPLAGMVLRTEAGHQIEVVEATPRRVRVVRIRPASKPASDDAPT